jgi:hypothetical protein
MYVDITGIILIPGNHGSDCPGNGTVPDLECCCDECDYCLLCFPELDLNEKNNNMESCLKGNFQLNIFPQKKNRE